MRQGHGDDRLGAERAGAEQAGQRRIDAPGEAQDDALTSGAGQLALDEPGDAIGLTFTIEHQGRQHSTGSFRAG